MKTKYLLKKLAEEAGEVVVAAIKYHLSPTVDKRVKLECEIGDLMALSGLLSAANQPLDVRNITLQCQRRTKKERDRA